MEYWPEEFIYIINQQYEVTIGLYWWMHIVDIPVSPESHYNDIPRGLEWPALFFVWYLCMFFCIINVEQCVKWQHVIMRLYSYISGSQVVLQSIFDTGHAASIVSATLGYGECKYTLSRLLNS